ncbi:MAG: PaaI family thioesterase [Rhodobacteraceae bacterium]|nr:PaaI family thioesterase [Paracoccaceae bacterium]
MTASLDPSDPATHSHRDAALAALMRGVPYIGFLGITVDRHGDELTLILPYQEKLLGNPDVPALHGGVTAAFLEITAIIELSWSLLWAGPAEALPQAHRTPPSETLPRLPKTIDFSVDYLRLGVPRDAYARARVNRSGRRYASVRVEAWQTHRRRLFAQSTVHFRMPPRQR